MVNREIETLRAREEKSVEIMACWWDDNKALSHKIISLEAKLLEAFSQEGQTWDRWPSAPNFLTTATPNLLTYPSSLSISFANTFSIYPSISAEVTRDIKKDVKEMKDATETKKGHSLDQL
ncbi:hypothetical protein DSO57_1032187 [Entomophthora muscae]|uniref:Uncharacterized protein n=1 Tax=Entomophthora muscae TaxID=34485 RepID=A0ACC2RF84_9FUNG|nr:hypothetical protein DSO57_1032187 [Entomophthora muscae]